MGWIELIGEAELVFDLPAEVALMGVTCGFGIGADFRSAGQRSEEVFEARWKRGHGFNCCLRGFLMMLAFAALLAVFMVVMGVMGSRVEKGVDGGLHRH